MKEVKSGDKLRLVAISWREKHWDFDHPTVVLEPCISYDPNGSGCWALLEDVAIDIDVNSYIPEDEDVSHEFEWRVWKLNRLKQVVKDRINGKDTWKSKIIEVMVQEVEFFKVKDEVGLSHKIISTKTF